MQRSDLRRGERGTPDLGDVAEEMRGATVAGVENLVNSLEEWRKAKAVSSMMGLIPPDLVEGGGAPHRWLVQTLAVDNHKVTSDCYMATGVDIVEGTGEIVEESGFPGYAHVEIKPINTIVGYTSMFYLDPMMLWNMSSSIDFDVIVIATGPDSSETIDKNSDSLSMYLWSLWPYEFVAGGVGAALAGVGLYKATGHKLGVGGL